MSTHFSALSDMISREARSYTGKYRGFVDDNEDPEHRGRIRAIVPSVLGATATDWALPCFPYGGVKDAGWIAVPPKDAQVVIEFLEGDLSAPIWTGTFWRSSGEVPAEVMGRTKPTSKLMKTEAGHFLRFEDDPDDPRVTLTSGKGAVIEMDKEGSLALTGSDGGTVTLDAKSGKLVIEDANGNSLVLSASGIDCTDANGNTITTSSGGIEVTASASVTIKGSSVALGGAGGEPLVKGQSFMALFNSHMHNCTGPGAPSGPPVVPMTPAMLTTITGAT